MVNVRGGRLFHVLDVNVRDVLDIGIINIYGMLVIVGFFI